MRLEDWRINPLHKLKLYKVLGLELFNFSRKKKIKPGINEAHLVIVDMSNDRWFQKMEVLKLDVKKFWL